MDADRARFWFNLNPTTSGLGLAASVSTEQTVTTLRTAVPWWLVVCAAVGAVGGATVAHLQYKAEERKLLEEAARERELRARRRRRLTT